MVDYVKEMTAKRACKYGDYRSFAFLVTSMSCKNVNHHKMIAMCLKVCLCFGC